MGWGIVDVAGSRMTHVANGHCKSSGEDLAGRLANLFGQLEAVFDEYRPNHAAVELVFVNKDAAGTLKLGHARAVCLLVPGRRGIPVREYAPNAIKKAVVGVGHADKVQVDTMVRFLLPGVGTAGPDSSDALATAICHAHHAQSSGRLEAILSSQAV